jgi:tRNA-guanine family transglycosylase
MAGEILSAQLNSLHNLYFYHRLMDKCREAIRVGQPELWPQLAETDGDAQAQTILEDS